MPKCPKCGNEIDELINYSKGWEKHRFWIDSQGYPQYEMDEFIPDEGNEWECPECNEVLFTDEEEATKFLKGEN